MGVRWRGAGAGGVVVGGGSEAGRVIRVETVSCCELGDGGSDDAGVCGEAAFDGVDGFAVVGSLAGHGRGVWDRDVLCSNFLPHGIARG